MAIRRPRRHSDGELAPLCREPGRVHPRMRIADETAAPFPDHRIRYERGQPMGTVPSQPYQVDRPVQTCGLLVKSVAFAAVNLQTRSALCGSDRRLVSRTDTASVHRWWL